MRALLQRLFGPRAHRDSFLTAHLLEALDRPGCPLCALVDAAILRNLQSVLYERVNHQGTHLALLASRGYCAEHTWAVPLAAAAAHSPTGVATLFERLLTDLLRTASGDERLLRWLQPAAACPLCVVAWETADAYLAEYARLLARRPELRHAPAVPCLPHLAALARYADAGAWESQRERARTALALAGPAERVARRAGGRPPGAAPTSATCPACRAANRAALLTADTAALCRQHAWLLFDWGREVDLTRAGAAAATGEAAGRGCPACRAGAAAAAATLDALDGAPLLCLGHLRLACEQGWLVRDAVVPALARLGADLRRFRDSADYRFTGVLTAAERASWVTVLARFGGESPGASLARPLPGASFALRGARDTRQRALRELSRVARPAPRAAPIGRVMPRPVGTAVVQVWDSRADGRRAARWPARGR
ncbi:MAG TPA: hypothetical protein VFL91_03545 [Thermomicrobiales bacterium]|nr:hypothetical protein [Thermomicrobiales bacterium]